MTKGRRLTIDDVASRAGVSRATVDRVINQRSGVSPKTREKVQIALEALDYSVSGLADLARDRPIRVEAILSEGTNPYFREIRAAIEAEGLARDDIALTLRGTDPYEPTAVLTHLDTLDPGTETVMIIGAEHPAVTEAVARLIHDGLRVVALVSDISTSRRVRFVGQDSFQAGRTAGRLMLNRIAREKGTIAVLTGHPGFRHLLDRRAGFEQTIALSGRDLRILQVPPYGAEASNFDAVLADALSGVEDLLGIYLSGGGQPGVFEAIAALQSARDFGFIAHELTATTRHGLANGRIDAIVAHDMLELARKAVDAAVLADPPRAATCGIRIFIAENLPHGD